MKLSPLDIRHKEFQSALNGFNKGQVRDFLARAADQFEERLEQIQQLTEQIKKQEKEIEALRVSDIELKRTLVTSERLSSEFKQQAEREAQLLLKETESKAEVILRDAELQKRQLLKTAEKQVQEANAARQKAEEAAKQIRERSIQESALQKKRAQNMVAGLKEESAQKETSNVEKQHAQEIAKVRSQSKTVILQLKKDIEKMKAERGQMLEQLNVYDKNLAELELKVTSKTELTKQPTSRKKQTQRRKPTRTQKQQSTSPQTNTQKLKTSQVANALSSSIDNLMSDSLLPNLLPEKALGLADTFGASANPTDLASNKATPIKEKIIPELFRDTQENPHDISYPKMDITHTDLDIAEPDPINITITPLDNSDFSQQKHLSKQERDRRSKELLLKKEHLSEQQLHFMEDDDLDISIMDTASDNNIDLKTKSVPNKLSQHVYPPYPVKESSVQDRGRLITPPTVYDVENPFIDDGFDELDGFGTFSESMVKKDTPLDNSLDSKGKEFDSNIFEIEDTLELPASKPTVEHIEVLDTEWFENFELEDD